MNQLTRITLTLAALAATSCGDDQQRLDASVHPDLDAPSFPAAPALGPQLDRVGRPAINTALNALLEPADIAAGMRDKYDQGAVASAWLDLVLRTGTPNQTTKLEFKANLAVLDALDTSATTGCGNQALYNGMASGGGAAAASSYDELATVLADDQLYVDTLKTSCQKYLSLEVDVATGGAITHTQCGGRAPTHDVIDVSYSLLVAGLSGFSTDGNLTPLITDGGVGVHSDVNDTMFPFLGAPH